MKYTESSLEEATREWFLELGYQTIFGAEVEPESESAEQEGSLKVVLAGCPTIDYRSHTMICHPRLDRGFRNYCSGFQLSLE